MNEEIHSGEEFGVINQVVNQMGVSRDEENDDDFLDNELDDEVADYLPQAIANDYLEQCELESLGLDSSKRNDPETTANISPIDSPPNTPPNSSSNINARPRSPSPPPSPLLTANKTPTAVWLQSRLNVPAECFVVGNGDKFHLFMKLRRKHKWRSKASATNFRAAELTWKQEIDMRAAQFPTEDPWPAYDWCTLRNKVLHIERMLPVYLEFWEGLSRDNIEVWVNSNGEECIVSKKIEYWRQQDLRDEISSTPASSKGKIDICKRCNMRKVTGSGHGTKTCTDGVLVSTSTEIVRYPQPSGLFISKEGRLNPAHLYHLLSISRSNPINDTETSNLSHFARHILLPNYTLDLVALANLQISIADQACIQEHISWQKSQKSRQERLQKKARILPL
jgi:hypothetical protein